VLRVAVKGALWEAPVKRFMALVSLLLLPGALRANTPAPTGYRDVPVVHIITTEHDYPEWEFWLVPRTKPGGVFGRLPVTPAHPMRVHPELPGGHYGQSYLFAVPKNLIAPFAGGAPPNEWFLDQRGHGVVELGLIDYPSRILPFTDNREQIEITYRIEMGPDGGRLVKVSENAGDPVYRWTRKISCCCLLPLGITAVVVWLGLRLVRRLR
jgi:hypothetical protein